MLKVNNKDTKTASSLSPWCFYCLLWNYFTPCFSVSVVDFEQGKEIFARFIHISEYLFKRHDQFL